MDMKRFLLLLVAATLGFFIASSIYKLLEPYFPMLPGLLTSLLPIITSGWFIAGVIGAVVAVLGLIAWAYSGEW